MIPNDKKGNEKDINRSKIIEKGVKMLKEHLTEEIKNLIKENNFTAWFKEMIIDPYLLKYFEEFLHENLCLPTENVRKSMKYDIKVGNQILILTYIAPILFQKVNFRTRSRKRMNKISKWATYDSLNRIFIDPKAEKVLNIRSIPHLYRVVDLDTLSKKFSVINGHHRFAYAAENEIQTVISYVEETYIISHSWLEKNIEKIKDLKKQKFDFNQLDFIINDNN